MRDRLRHAARKDAEQRRTPTWCEIVGSLATAVGVLISLIQLLRGRAPSGVARIAAGWLPLIGPRDRLECPSR